MSTPEIEIATLLARTACALRHAHYTRALTRLEFAIERIDLAADYVPHEVLARAAKLAEALAVIAQGRTELGR